MPRIPSRVAVLIAALVLFASPATAQPPDPLELARGLRDNGMADLALEYLDGLGKKNPPPALAAILPLERARARLALAEDETEETKRDALIVQAKSEFEQFLATNANHPRRAEAALALARVVSAQVKAALARANKVEDAAQRKAELVKTRPIFNDASTRFGQAAAAYAKTLDNPDLTPAQKKEITRDLYQAELDRAINSFMLSRTYDPPEGVKEVEARGKAIDQARDLFKALAARDDTHPICWKARAWVGECEREKDNPQEAQAQFNQVKEVAKKVPAAAEGARLVRFFEMRAEYEKAFKDNTPAAFKKAQGLIEQWLAEPAARLPRPAPEVYAARFYLAVVKHQQARFLIKEDPKTKQPVVGESARELLRQADRDYRRVLEPDNDYSDRAAERRTQVIRLLIGDGEKDPAKMTNFDEVLMAAQVQIWRAVKEAKSPEERTKGMVKAAALYERARELPVPKDSAREAANAQVNLVFTYLMGERPYQAAVLGEHLARTLRAPGPAARAGLYALQAYLQAASKLDEADAEGRKGDRARAVRIGLYLDERFPNDTSTDAARLQLGSLLYRDGKHREAFDLLARVSPSSPRVTNARLLQGAAAFELLRPDSGGAEASKSGLTPQQRAEIYRRIVADLTAIPDPGPSAPAEGAELAVAVTLQLAELHLTDKPNGYAKAEKAAADAKAKIARYTALSEEDRQELILRAEHVRLRALFAQAYPLYQAGKYAEAVARVAPALADAARDGPVAKPGQPEAVAAAARRVDDFRRDSLLVLAMQARIKEGAVDKVGELFDLMKKLGGSLEASVGALGQLIAAVRPQIEELRKAGKTEEADKLAAGVGLVLDKVAAEPNITPRVLVALGAGLKDMGQYDRAIEVLTKVPAPPDEELRKRANELDDKVRTAVMAYRAAKLETARAHRLAKHYDQSDAILKEVLGTKEKPGWAANIPDFRREAAYLIEDRAEATADAKEAQKLWSEALLKWKEMSNDYLPTLRKLKAGRKDNDSAFRALMELKQLPPHELLPKNPDEIKKDYAEKKKPWVARLLSERIKGPDGKEQPNPVAREYVQTLRNTVTRLESQLKPLYHDVFFEYTRCITRANAHLFKDKPAELPKKMEAIAKTIRELERDNPDLSSEVQGKFATLMKDFPTLGQEYEKIGKLTPTVVATAEASPGEESPTTGDQSGTSEAAKTSEGEAQPRSVATPPPAPESDSTGLLIGLGVGLLALLGVVGYIVFGRKKGPPPRRTTGLPPPFAR